MTIITTIIRKVYLLHQAFIFTTQAAQEIKPEQECSCTRYIKDKEVRSSLIFMQRGLACAQLFAGLFCNPYKQNIPESSRVVPKNSYSCLFFRESHTICTIETTLGGVSLNTSIIWTFG